MRSSIQRTVLVVAGLLVAGLVAIPFLYRANAGNGQVETLPMGLLLERQDESVVPFGEVQSAIREKIREERSKVATEEYVKKLRSKFPVWTIFDEPN